MVASAVVNVSFRSISRCISLMKAVHGGDLELASQLFNVPVEDWVDLSTGINPRSYPLSNIEESAFQQLPYLKPAFIQAAQDYYLGEENTQLTAENSLAVSGSQAVIQLLPRCLPSLPVLLPEIGYQEHRMQWLQSGVTVTEYPSEDLEPTALFINQALEHNCCQHIVIINPNNPTGLKFTPAQLQRWAAKLGEGAYLIIDEAFIDTCAEWSVLPHHFEQNMIVLRSFGKFFGLAGLRLGFVFAHKTLIRRFTQHLGLWAINGPAQSIATRAFHDTTWQQQARVNISQASLLSQTLFQPLFSDKVAEIQGLQRSFHDELFSSYHLPIKHAERLTQFFARQGILIRLIEIGSEGALLRIGRLDPKNEKSLYKLQTVIALYIAYLVK